MGGIQCYPIAAVTPVPNVDMVSETTKTYTCACTVTGQLVGAKVTVRT